jgi:ERF superfamily
MMSVYKKLMDARLQLQSYPLKKSGNNKFAGYKYFELGDFLPAVQEIFSGLGLCGVVSFGKDDASLTIIDIENPADRIVIGTPMSTAALKGCHEVQNLGAVQTYLRRYLWVTAMEIVEHDALDSSEPIKPEVKKPIVVDTSVMPPKTIPKPAKEEELKPTGISWKIQVKEYEQGGFAGAVLEGAQMALDMASSPTDVVEIFKVNRELLDQLSKEMPEEHKELLAKFSATKTKLSGE